MMICVGCVIGLSEANVEGEHNQNEVYMPNRCKMIKFHFLKHMCNAFFKAFD